MRPPAWNVRTDATERTVDFQSAVKDVYAFEYLPRRSTGPKLQSLSFKNSGLIWQDALSHQIDSNVQQMTGARAVAQNSRLFGSRLAQVLSLGRFGLLPEWVRATIAICPARWKAPRRH